MTSRFEPDVETSVPHPKGDARSNGPLDSFEDSQEYDASEQQFAASLNAAPQARFVVEESSSPAPRSTRAEERVDGQSEKAQSVEPLFALSPPEPQHSEPDSWRREVAAKLSKYNEGRQPRKPKYPSLKLKFEPNDPSPNYASNSDSSSRPAQSRETTVRKTVEEVDGEIAEPAPIQPRKSTVAEITGRILEFPRSFFPPSRPADELAEPVFDRPRILEVPEQLPLPPALGGILIEPAEMPAEEKRPGFELPLQPARMSRRFWAAAADGVVVLLALATFGSIFFRITKTVPMLKETAVMTAVITGMFWIGYQYLLLIYCGSTLGLKAARLRLSLFDGSPVPRKLRIWRVAASILSALSLGLGYAWCFLDEDQLCWHDRITRTYMAPTSPHILDKMI
ncbi:MAG: hypothetical protein QOD84_1947 [Acidobacteriaceae bacterium]